MFVKTVKVKNLGYIAIGIVILALIVAGCVLLGKGNKAVSYKMENEAERVAFLTGLGWDISQQYTDCKVVVIPEAFDEVYTEYNKLQKKQGFDLSGCKGKTAEIYTYEVKNYPNYPTGIVANLIIIDGVLVGGDVCCTNLDGFIQGLIMPSVNSSATSDDTSADSSSQADNTASHSDDCSCDICDSCSCGECDECKASSRTDDIQEPSSQSGEIIRSSTIS